MPSTFDERSFKIHTMSAIIPSPAEAAFFRPAEAQRVYQSLSGEFGELFAVLNAVDVEPFYRTPAAAAKVPFRSAHVKHFVVAL
jgi:hypothetical protein